MSEKSRNFAPMIELQRHIEVLLLTNDCVIVPGLGGFMAHHIDARFDEEDNTFVPPLRTLGFNQNLTMNDSLLVQSYIESYDISYPEALRRIEDEVEELRQHLQTEGYYELNDIGVLALNAEGNIEFAPCEAGILTPGLYGLGTFEMMPLHNHVKAAAEVEVDEEAASDEPVTEQTAKETTSAASTVIDEEHERAIIIKMSWIRHAVAVAAAVAAFFMIGTPVSNSSLDTQKGMQQSSFIPISTKSTTAENQVTAIEASVADEAVTAKAPITEQPSTPAVAASSSEEYCIVLASQVSKKNADGFVEQLAKNGFNDAYISNTKFRRVVYGRFATKDDASAKLRELRSRSKKFFGDGWVMRIDN